MAKIFSVPQPSKNLNDAIGRSRQLAVKEPWVVSLLIGAVIFPSAKMVLRIIEPLAAIPAARIG